MVFHGEGTVQSHAPDQPAPTQQITVNYVPQVPGSTLDLTAYTSNAAPGNCFYADDASVKISS